MIFASTFLSHVSKDGKLAEAVAGELGRRGVIAWMDGNELKPGASFPEALKEAVGRQAAVSLFLSRSFLEFPRAEEKLAEILTLEASGFRDRIFPIYFEYLWNR